MNIEVKLMLKEQKITGELFEYFFIVRSDQKKKILSGRN